MSPFGEYSIYYKVFSKGEKKKKFQSFPLLYALGLGLIIISTNNNKKKGRVRDEEERVCVCVLLFHPSSSWASVLLLPHGGTPPIAHAGLMEGVFFLRLEMYYYYISFIYDYIQRYISINCNCSSLSSERPRSVILVQRP